jgi:DNA-binding response OmpR family regulator
MKDESPSRNSILLVEDNELLRRSMARFLRDHFTVLESGSIAEAKETLKAQTVDLVVLDMTLPDGDGTRLCAYLQSVPRLSQMPVIVLTGRAEVEDKLAAFSLGADDYVNKPVESRELIARIQARLKRIRSQRISEQHLVRGSLQINLERQKVFRTDDEGEHEIELTPIEFKLLLYFARHEGHVLSRDQLLEGAWGDGTHIIDRTVDTHVSNLRKKLASSTHTIRSRHGMGYEFTSEAPVASSRRAT